MNPNESGSPEAQPRAAFIQRAQADAIDIDEAVKRAVAGIERWYAQHFHRAITTGASPIPADQKAALAESVKSAITQE